MIKKQTQIILTCDAQQSHLCDHVVEIPGAVTIKSAESWMHGRGWHQATVMGMKTQVCAMCWQLMQIAQKKANGK